MQNDDTNQKMKFDFNDFSWKCEQICSGLSLSSHLLKNYLIYSFAYPVDTGRKLNVHKTFKRRPGLHLNLYLLSVYQYFIANENQPNK